MATENLEETDWVTFGVILRKVTPQSANSVSALLIPELCLPGLKGSPALHLMPASSSKVTPSGHSSLGWRSRVVSAKNMAERQRGRTVGLRVVHPSDCVSVLTM